MTATPVVLVLGAGSNIGHNVAREFGLHGYKVALAARSPSSELSRSAELMIKADLSDSSAVIKVFEEVIAKLGHPNVVVYNAALVLPSPPNNPLEQDISEVKANLDVNFFSAYVAAQQAVKSFSAASKSVEKTFIFTGNILNTTAIPGLLAFGAGKSASAHMIANTSKAYAKENYQFYYVDERKADGSHLRKEEVNGEEHAKQFWHLAERSDHGPWLWTFVSGKGYVDFRN